MSRLTKPTYNVLCQTLSIPSYLLVHVMHVICIADVQSLGMLVGKRAGKKRKMKILNPKG